MAHMGRGGHLALGQASGRSRQIAGQGMHGVSAEKVTWQWMAESLPSVSLRWELRGVSVGATAGSMVAMLLALSPLPRRRRKKESFSSSCALGRCSTGPKHLRRQP